MSAKRLRWKTHGKKSADAVKIASQSANEQSFRAGTHVTTRNLRVTPLAVSSKAFPAREGFCIFRLTTPFAAAYNI